MAIPLSEVPSVIRGARDTRRLSAGALGAGARALQGIGGEIEQAAGVSERFLRSKIQAEDSSAVADAQRQLKIASSNFDTSIAQEGDETKWESIWDEQAAGVTKMLVTDQKLRPAARQQIEGMVTDWNISGGLNARGQADVRSIQRSGAKMTEAAESFLEDGDFESFEVTTNEMLRLNLLTPEQHQKRIARGQQQIDYFELVEDTTDDPWKAEELLAERTKGGKPKNYKNLSVANRRDFAGWVDRQKNQVMTEHHNRIKDLAFESSINKGTNRDKEKLWEETVLLHEEGKITTGHKISLRNTIFDKAAQKNDFPGIEAWDQEFRNYDPATDPNGVKYNELQAAIFSLNVPDKLVTQHYGRLNAKRDGTGIHSKRLDSKKQKEIFSLIDRRRAGSTVVPNYYAGPAVFPDDDFDIENPEHRARSAVAYLEDKELADEMIEANPGMSASDIWKQMNGLVNDATNRKNGMRAFSQTVEDKGRTFRPTSVSERETVGRSAMVRGLNQTFPSLRADMSVGAAIDAAEADKGAELTELEQLDILGAFTSFRGRAAAAPDIIN